MKSGYNYDVTKGLPRRANSIVMRRRQLPFKVNMMVYGFRWPKIWSETAERFATEKEADARVDAFLEFNYTPSAFQV